MKARLPATLTAIADQVVANPGQVSENTALALELAASALSDYEVTTLPVPTHETTVLNAHAESIGSIFYIKVPDPLARRFPDPEIYNHGHPAHITLCYVTSDALSSGDQSALLNMARRLGRHLRRFRVVLDANAGLKDFGKKDGDDQMALWVPAASDPKQAFQYVHDQIKRGLAQDGLPCQAFPDFVPHCTWQYVNNDVSEIDRARSSVMAAERLGRSWFTVDHICLDIGPKTYQIPLRGV